MVPFVESYFAAIPFWVGDVTGKMVEVARGKGDTLLPDTCSKKYGVIMSNHKRRYDQGKTSLPFPNVDVTCSYLYRAAAAQMSDAPTQPGPLTVETNLSGRVIRCHADLDATTHMGVVYAYAKRKKVYTLKFYKTNPPATRAVKVIRDVSIADTTAMLLESLPEELTAPVEESNIDSDSEDEIPAESEGEEQIVGTEHGDDSGDESSSSDESSGG
jgi:hypothetical protein